MLIMSRTIFPRSFKFIYFCLIGFWELWLFNYPFSFTLYFPTPNLMDWDETMGFPPYFLKNLWSMFHLNPMRQSKVIGSPSWVSNLGINGGEGKWPRINPNVLIWFCSDSWVTLLLHTCILTPNFDPWSLICAIRYWRVREELGWEEKHNFYFKWI